MPYDPIKRRPRCHKVPQASQGKAEAQLRSLVQRGLGQADELTVYWCSQHRAWHVGHRIGLKSRKGGGR